MNWITTRKRRLRSRRLLLAALGLGGALALLAGLGWLLDAEQSWSGEALLDRPPETIWRVLTDFDGMPLWRSDLRALERLPDLSGRPAWRELGRHGTRIVELAAAQPPRLLVYATTRSGRLSFPTWTVLLSALPQGRGTRVRLTESDRVGNPLRRVLNRAVPPRGALERFLKDLIQRVNGERKQLGAR